MPNENTSSPSTRDRGLRRLHRLTLAVAGGAVAALGAFAYTAAVTIPGTSLKVAAVTAAASTVDTTTTTTTTTTTPSTAPTAVPTPAPTASSNPVAVSGGSK